MFSKLPLTNRKTLLCGKSEAEGGKEVTAGLLTGGRLVSIPPQRNADEVSEPARKLKLQEANHFLPQNSYFQAPIQPMHVPHAYPNTFKQPKKDAEPFLPASPWPSGGPSCAGTAPCTQTFDSFLQP